MTTTSTCIYVGNLFHLMDDEQLYAIFSRFGPIRYATVKKRLMPDGQWLSLGYGFVGFESAESAKKAFIMHGFMGIKIGFAKEKPEFFKNAVVKTVSDGQSALQTSTNVETLWNIEPVAESSSKVDENIKAQEEDARDQQLRAIEAQTFGDNDCILISGSSVSTANLDFLHSHFSKCSPIEAISMLHNPSDEEGIQGIAKIKFNNKRAAAMAILDLENAMLGEWQILGGKLHCEWWSEKTEENLNPGLWLPKTKQLIESPPPLFDDDDESESETPSKVKELSGFLKSNPDLPTTERIKLIMDLLNKI